MLIDEIWKRRHVIVTGQGGGGKKVFMKYLWIAFFENPRGRIPVFVELRRLNEVAKTDLLLFTYLSIVGAHAALTRDDFDKGVREGIFVFLFDGFDEIVNEKRAAIEKQILDLTHNNSECIVAVSGRSDERFNAWQSFSNFSVLPMNKEEILKLIGKLKYDRLITKNFMGSRKERPV